MQKTTHNFWSPLLQVHTSECPASTQTRANNCQVVGGIEFNMHNSVFTSVIIAIAYWCHDSYVNNRSITEMAGYQVHCLQQSMQSFR